jgi:hypothetical protein
MKNTKFIDKCFKDKNGNVVLGQKPNLPIIVWLVTLILKLFINGTLYNIVDIIGFGALFTWAWLELFDGVNYLRRVFGFFVLLVLIISRIN